MYNIEIERYHSAHKVSSKILPAKYIYIYIYVHVLHYINKNSNTTLSINIRTKYGHSKIT